MTFKEKIDKLPELARNYVLEQINKEAVIAYMRETISKISGLQNMPVSQISVIFPILEGDKIKVDEVCLVMTMSDCLDYLEEKE